MQKKGVCFLKKGRTLLKKSIYAFFRKDACFFPRRFSYSGIMYYFCIKKMSGLYIHVPFCEKRCLYCDFYSNTDSRYKSAYLEALIREMEMRKGYLQDEPLKTIYFGGGTPSQLSVAELERIFEAIYRNFRTTEEMEITLEANPDDMKPRYVAALQALPINRISMGVQSFDETDLKFLNRRHDKAEAIRAVELCRQYHIYNISIDLIYGLPRQSLEEWDADLSTALSLQVQHISAYALIYEEGTRLWKMRRQHIVEEADEELSLKMFDHLIDELSANGFEHYEISNFARPGFRSRHNSSYWQGIPYLGCGPSAHSYDGQDRQWNRPDLTGYIDHVGRASRPADFDNAPWIEKEELSLHERYNDRIVTALRTSDGLDLNRLKSDFGQTLYDYCLQAAAPHLRDGLIERISSTREKQVPNDLLKLTRRGLFLSDGIMSDLLYVAD